MGNLDEREERVVAAKRKSFVETMASSDSNGQEISAQLSYYIPDDLLDSLTIKTSLIDYIACKSLKLECPEYIIPFTTDSSGESTEIIYAVGANKANLHHFSDTIKMEQILHLYNEIMGYLEECGNLFLKKTGFCFDTQYVFLDEQKKSIHFIYVPHKHYSSSEIDIKQVFMELLEKCAPNSGETIQLQLYKYFYKPKFSLKEFKKILEPLQVQPIKKSTVSLKSEPTPEIKPHIEPVFEPESEPVFEPGPIFEPEPEPIFESEPVLESEPVFEPEPVFEAEATHKSILEQASKPKVQESEKSERNNYAQANIDKIVEMASKNNKSGENLNKESTLIHGIEDDEIASASSLSLSSNTKFEGGSRATSRLELPKASDTKRKNLFGNIFSTPKDSGVEIPPPDPQVGLRLKLVNEKSKYNLPKTIMINFEGNVFTLGRCGDHSESAQSHFEFSQEVNPISRQHTKIEQKGDNYYLIDKGSRNGTFLNGKRIDANKPYQLYHNDIIAFAIAFSDNSIRYVFLEQ